MKRLVLCAQLLAAFACEGSESMATPINWGKGYEISYLRSSPQEMARVELPESRDLTIMLGDPAEIRNYATQCDCSITVGNGGTSYELKLNSSVRGTVLHVVARSVVVRAQLRNVAISDNPPPGGVFKSRFAVQVGLGSPSRHQITHARTVATPGTTYIPLMPWSHSVAIVSVPEGSGTGGGPGTISNLHVSQVNIDPGGNSPVATTHLLTQFGLGLPIPLVPLANALSVNNVGGSNQDIYITEFFDL
jgi:hypothetical protein